MRRLSRYYRYLEELKEREKKVVTSAQLAAKCMVDPNQLRKDLNFFGEFGTRGLGYHVKDLLSDIRRVLGLNKERRIAVIGIGDLGSPPTMPTSSSWSVGSDQTKSLKLARNP